MSVRFTDSAKKSAANNLNRQVAQYSLVAAIAGVSMLALAQPAAGEVVITRKTILIPRAPVDLPQPVNISMANNGVDNFIFNLESFPPVSGHSSSFRALILAGATSKDNPVFAGTFHTYTPALARGAGIGASAIFSPVECIVENSLAYNTNRGLRGYWGGNQIDRYVGVRFPINGQTHYGWIRLTVTTDPQPHGSPMSAKITGYAYETVPNKKILAGIAGTAGSAQKPTAQVQAPQNLRDQNQAGPSLGMLAAGADALPAWRREETLTSN